MNTSVALMQSSQVGIQKSLLVGKGYNVEEGENVTFKVGQSRRENGSVFRRGTFGTALRAGPSGTCRRRQPVSRQSTIRGVLRRCCVLKRKTQR